MSYNYKKIYISKEDDPNTQGYLTISFIEISKNGNIAICFGKAFGNNYIAYSTNFLSETPTWNSDKNGSIPSDKTFAKTVSLFNGRDNYLKVFYISTMQYDHYADEPEKFVKINYYEIDDKSYRTGYIENERAKDVLSDNDKYYDIKCSYDEKTLSIASSDNVFLIDITKTESKSLPNNTISGGYTVTNISCFNVYDDENNNFSDFGSGIYVFNSKIYYFYTDGNDLAIGNAITDRKYDQVSNIIQEESTGKIFVITSTYDSYNIFLQEITFNDTRTNITLTNKKTINYIWDNGNIKYYSKYNYIFSSSFGIGYSYSSSINTLSCSQYNPITWVSSSGVYNNSMTCVGCNGTEYYYYLNTSIPMENILTKNFISDDTLFGSDYHPSLIETSNDFDKVICASYKDKKNNLHYTTSYVENPSNTWIMYTETTTEHKFIASTSYTAGSGDLVSFYVTDKEDINYILAYEIETRSFNKYTLYTTKAGRYYSISVTPNGDQLTIGAKHKLLILESNDDTSVITNNYTTYSTGDDNDLYIRQVSCSPSRNKEGIFYHYDDGNHDLYTYYYEDQENKIKYKYLNHSFEISNLIHIDGEANNINYFYAIRKNDNTGFYYIQKIKITFNKSSTVIEDIKDFSTYEKTYNWSFNNLRAYDSDNFSFSGNFGLIHSDDGYFKECVKYGKDMKWCAISYKLNNESKYFACDGVTNKIYTYSMETSATITQQTEPLKITNNIEEQNEILKIKILKKINKKLKKLKCSSRFKYLQNKLLDCKNIKYFVKIIKCFIKTLNKIKKKLQYNRNFSVKITLYSYTGQEIITNKIIMFNLNKGFISPNIDFNNSNNILFNKYIDNIVDKKNKGKILLILDFFSQ